MGSNGVTHWAERDAEGMRRLDVVDWVNRSGVWGDERRR